MSWWPSFARPGAPPRAPRPDAPARPRPARPALAALCLALALSGCAAGPYVWVDEYPDAAPPRDPTYVIAPGDVLGVKVWNQDGLSASRLRVREDGMISLPFLHDVEAAGHSPDLLARQLQTRLKDYLRNPVVTVSLEESRPVSVTVLGEVTRGGLIQLEPDAGVLQALAGAGGFSEYAHRDRIFVLRRAPGAALPARIRFSYEALIHVQGRAPAFRLRKDDVVVVE